MITALALATGIISALACWALALQSRRRTHGKS